MRRTSPALAISAALLLAASAAPALAATTTTPATGAAQSTLTLLDLALGGHTVSAGQIAAVASNTGSRVAQIVVTPAVLDGHAVGQQTVTPANAPATVPSGSPQTVSVPNLLSVTGPTLALDAQSSSTQVLTTAALKALGAVNLTPAGLANLPINLQTASLSNIAKVTASQTEATKSVVIGGLALPSVTQLLSGLGVDLNALLDQLTQGNLDRLGGLVGANLTTLNSAVDTAQVALTSAGQTASDTLSSAQSAKSAATSAASAAQTTADTAQTAATAADTAWTTAVTALSSTLAGLSLPTNLPATAFASLTQGQKDALALVVPNVATLAASAVSADAAFQVAQGALTAANALVALVNNLVNALQALVNSVASAVTGDTDPLAVLGNISVTTTAIASQNSPAPVAEAKVGTLKILGSDAAPAQLTAALGTVTQTLSDVLRSVAGVAFTPPSVSIGSGHTSRSVSGTTHKSTASITGLTITLPSITLPSVLSTVTTAVPGATTIAGNAVSVLGGTVHVAVLAESATHTPSTSTTSSGTPGTPGTSGTPSTPTTSSGNPSLAGTGLSHTVPVVAALFIVAALAVLHRRRMTSEH